MDAVISGRTGKAVAMDGESVLTLDLDGAEKPVRRRPVELSLLLGEMSDIVILENTDREEILNRLHLERNYAYTLDLALISLDPDLPTKVRTKAVQGLEELLGDPRVSNYLEYTLYAKPLPRESDLKGALDCCDGDKVSTVRRLFERLGENQAIIREVRIDWEAIPEKVFGGSLPKAEFHDLAVREGLFRDLALSASASSIATFLLMTLCRTSVQAHHNHHEILRRWSDAVIEAAVTSRQMVTEAREAPGEFSGETETRKPS